MGRRIASQKGAAMVEFAIILVPLLIITFGIIEFGMLLYNQQVITNASREGARAGIVSKNPRLPPTGVDSIDSKVQLYCKDRMITFGATNNPVTTVIGYIANPVFSDNNELRVQVSYVYSFLVIPNFIPGIDKIKNMRAESVMRYE